MSPRLKWGERWLRTGNVATWMIWETGTKSLREIGELLGEIDYAAVAQRIGRTRLAHSPAAARKLLGQNIKYKKS